MNKKKLKNLLSYYGPHKAVFAADLFFAVTAAVITVAIPLIVRYIATDIVLWDVSAALRGVAIAGAALLVMLFVEMGCNYFVINYGHIMGARMEETMRNQLFEHYQSLSFSFYDDQKVGQLMSRVTGDLFEISELLHHGPEEIVICAIKLFGSFGVLLSINWRLALVAFVPVPFMICFAVYYNKKMSAAFVRNRARIGDINATMEDSLSGIRVVKSFANEEVEIDKFHRRNQGFVESKKDSYGYMARYHTVLGALSTFITIAVACAGGLLLIFGYADVSVMLVFLLYISNFTEPIRKLVFVTEQFQNGFSGYIRFSQMMDISPEIYDAPGAGELTDVKGGISFENVSFHYGQGENIFENLNLNIRAGDYVALVGTSGVGKSTLCGLIPRFYDVSSGSVSIDGRDVRSVTLKSLRESIGMVQQDVYLFAGTVMENIRYGKPGATDQEVMEAARLANAHDFIMELPQGYGTDVGQRGLKLSGGQKQRLSIARVFLKNPSILIFDEATSALDNESERVVQESLERLAKDRTTLVIAHRLSTIHNAKRILVLTPGGIAEEGDHETLIKAGGQYAALYNAAVI